LHLGSVEEKAELSGDYKYSENSPFRNSVQVSGPLLRQALFDGGGGRRSLFGFLSSGLGLGLFLPGRC
jgi:hypothetical protein